MGPFLSLAVLWAGVAIPLVDRGMLDPGAPALTDPDAGTPPFTHDHQLCLLFHASPGWASSGPAAVAHLAPFRESEPSTQRRWVPGEAPRHGTARAPPSTI